MAKFSFQGRNAQGQGVNGEIEAGSEGEARIKLKAQNIAVTKVSLVAPSKTGADSSKRVAGRELQIFTRQFSTLINAGIPIVDALKILSDGTQDKTLKEVSARVKSSIEGGRRLSDAMAQFPKVFDRLYCNMVQAGEEAGILDGILNRLSVYIEKSEKIKSQVKGAMVYPIIVLIVASIVVTGILIFIIPKFAEVFQGAGQELPALTQMVLNLSHALSRYWYLVIGLFTVVPFAIKHYLETPAGSAQLDIILIKTPVVGNLTQKSALARMTRTLSTLLSSGVGLVEAIDISAKTAGNTVVENSLTRCKEAVIQGKTFASPLTKEKLIPEMVVQMVGIGEQSGTLDTMLGKVADFYEEEVETAVKSLTSVIEPILMIVLGSIIAVLVIAMYLPIFNLGNTLG